MILLHYFFKDFVPNLFKDIFNIIIIIMYFNQQLSNVDVICINLITRPERKTHTKLICKNNNIPIRFYTAKPHSDPKRGCLESHINVIKSASEKGKSQHLMIIEDDIKIIRPLKDLPNPPPDWDIIYFGGTVHTNKGSYDNDWCKIATWTTHAYIINLTNKALVQDLIRAKKQDKELDEYYIKNIHFKYNCYMINPMRIIQRDGYSDIEKAEVKYDFMEDTLKGFRQPEHETLTSGDYVLKLDFVPPELLPPVSIITPTFNRRKLFAMALNNFMEFNYPKEKLEWIIIDDSNDESLSVEDMLPRGDKRIRYIKIDTKDRLSVAHKRNIGAREAKYEYIVHMDDDDYYPKESVMARIKILLKYQSQEIGCVGCSRVGIYDVVNNTSSIATDGIISLSEASMAYTKQFWAKQQFNEFETEGEYKSFIQGRFNQIMDIPYSFVIFAFSHKTNFTGTTKRIDKNVLVHKDTGEEMNFYDQWPEDIQQLVDSIRKNI